MSEARGGGRLWRRSDALEVVERLVAGAAAVVRLAGGRAELAHPFGVAAVTARTGYKRGLPQAARTCDRLLGRRNPERLELAPPRARQPPARPGRRQHLVEDNVRE